MTGVRPIPSALRRWFAKPSRQDTRQLPEYRGWVTSNDPQVPQRFGDNHHRYIAQGGQLDIARLLSGFTAGNPNNRGDLNRFYALALIYDQIVRERLYGDVAELGVYKGNTAVILADLARRIGSTAYLLDTFAGFAASDLQGVDANKRFEFGDTSLPQVQNLVGTENVRWVTGLFPGTADQLPPDARFCLVHIDCDLYAPFKSALAFFYDRLVPGGFMVMHDYSSLHWDGAQRAVDEFFSKRTESVMPLPDGSGTVVVRKSKPASGTNNWYDQGAGGGFAFAWVPAGTPAVTDALTSGWSQPEDWGVWGLGGSHRLSLPLSRMPEGDVVLEVDSQVVLLPTRTELAVDVFSGGDKLATWTYNEQVNRGIRTVHIPRGTIDTPMVRLEFRPSSFAPPHDLNPANSDDRQLGMGLVRFRQRQL